jgi:hypothetical protein
VPEEKSQPAEPEPALTPEPPAPEPVSSRIAVTLAARRMSATLLNTALSYELPLTNISPGPLGPISVEGDMIAAHGSIPQSEQIALDGAQLVPLHRVEMLEPGASATLAGEFRLPLAAITPIRSGNAALFVPLARFRIVTPQTDAPPLGFAHTFVIGETPARVDAALKPFRLDLGPRLYSQISQREIAA